MKYFKIFIVIMIAFFIGALVGERYVLHYQHISSTDTGYSVEINYNTYNYDEGMYSNESN